MTTPTNVDTLLNELRLAIQDFVEATQSEEYLRANNLFCSVLDQLYEIGGKTLVIESLRSVGTIPDRACPDTLDPKLCEQLENELDVLAGTYRYFRGNRAKQCEIVDKYTATMQRLYSLGWQSSIEVEWLLPPEHMPVGWRHVYTRK